jgi:stress response protein SCP2
VVALEVDTRAHLAEVKLVETEQQTTVAAAAQLMTPQRVWEMAQVATVAIQTTVEAAAQEAM